jgi:histone deacetylase 11
MRWATMGTVVAAKEARRHGFAVNLGGGYHHAKPHGGEGFCVYSDIALAIYLMRQEGLLNTDDRVAYVDLDAHQGNGVCHEFMHDRRVFIFDMYNSEIFPSYDMEARERIDCDVRLAGMCKDIDYLRELNTHLPGFLDSITRRQGVALAIYNAGTDVFLGDPLGGLCLTAEAILQRDLFVVQELRKRGIATMMLLSGGYTRFSHKMVADSVIHLLDWEMERP